MFQPPVTTNAIKDVRDQQRRATQALSAAAARKDWDVVVVGCGISGALAAYNLAVLPSGPQRVLVVDHGEVGAGTKERFACPPVVGAVKGPPPPKPSEDLGDELKYHTGNSGGVSFTPPHFTQGPLCVKFSVRLYPSTTPNFIEHHGKAGTRRYLAMSALGIDIQRSLCKKLFTPADTSLVLEEAGSVLLAEAKDEANLREEYSLLRELGVDDVEIWDRAKIIALHGEASGFVLGLYFPNDIRVDALAFARTVVKAAVDTGRVELISHTPSLETVVDVAIPSGRGVSLRFRDGTTLQAKQCVVATNALYLNKDLAGILTPCWSYFVTLPHGRGEKMVSNQTTQSSHNYMTYGFTHDWCVTKGKYRVSGADHFSALKPPRAFRRCGALATWSLGKYPYMESLLPGAKTSSIEERLEGRIVYGVYGETPDMLPLVGMTRPGSGICYLLGCNAWGQASLSAAASLVPGILGYKDLKAEEVELVRDLGISRYRSQAWYERAKL